MLMPAASASPLPSTSPAALNAALTANGVIAAANGLPPAPAAATVTIGPAAVVPSIAETTSIVTASGTSPTTATATVPSVLPAASTATTAPAMVNHTSQKDTTWTKLFVGGLPYHTTDKSLREHFEVYGEIEEAVVITDRQTGKSRGYGFVIMATKEAAERACKEPNPIIDGRKANVNLAILGAKPRINSFQVGLPLTALRQSFHALLPAAAAATGQIGDLTSLVPMAAQASNPAALNPAAAAAAAAAAAQAAAVATSQASATAGGKARSSMSLPMISGRLAPAAAAASNPYLQQMYAAAAAAQNPYAGLQGTGLISLAQNPMAAGQQAAGTTGNPLLDAYSQYAALAAQGVYTTSASATGASYTSPLDTVQAANGMSGYLTAGGYYAPAAMAGMTGMTGATATPGLAAYAAAAGPTVSSQATAADGRIQ